MDRPTIEVTLPISGSRVVLYQYLTTTESRAMRRASLAAMKMKVKTDGTAPDISEMSGEFTMELEEMALKALVKEIYDDKGALVSDVIAYIGSLRDVDGDFLYKKINELSQSSNMSPEVKKK